MTLYQLRRTSLLFVALLLCIFARLQRRKKRSPTTRPARLLEIRRIRRRANLENAARPDFSVTPSVPLPRRRSLAPRSTSRRLSAPPADRIRARRTRTTCVFRMVRPRDLSNYREIIRKEDHEQRFLSFQNSGHVLALGLNVGGSYQECDAEISPIDFLDGSCALSRRL